MPISPKYLAEFVEGHLYHVYNRTNNKELLFLTDENKRYFLQRFKDIVSPFVDTYCWCILPNHFHLLIRVKTEKAVTEILKSKATKDLTKTEQRYLMGLDKVANLQKVGNLTVDENLLKVGKLTGDESLLKVGNLSGDEKLSKVGNLTGDEIHLPPPTYSELIEQTFKRFFQAYALAFNKLHTRRGNLFYKPFKRVLINKDTQFTMTIIYIHANAMKHGLVKDFTTYQWSSWHTLLSNNPTLLAKNELLDWFGSLDSCIKAHRELSKYYFACDTAIEDE
jgi:REP element-mobilizing transposase RayT